MNFSGFFRIFQNKESIFHYFISAQVMLRNLEHLIESRSSIKVRGDVVAREAPDRMIKSRSSIVT